jgi:Uma2 family endonuclease
VIEVAVSSQRRDLMVKAPKYAAAGVRVYLVVDLDARRVIEHTDPRNGVYRSAVEVEQLDAGLPGVAPLRAAELLAAAFS